MESYHISPLRYPGGKNRIFPFVSKLLDENGLRGIRYAEPYAGGAGLALRLLLNNFVSQIYINDRDIAIYSFWKTILKQNERFCDWIDSVSVDMDSWRFFRNVQQNMRNADSFQIAQATFFLNRTNVSGVLLGGVIGGNEQNGKYKMDARFHRKNLIDRIRQIYEYRKQIFVSNQDGLQFMKRFEQQKKDIFLYMDPPYYQKGTELYMNAYNEADHIKLSQYLPQRQSNWLISYDDHPQILNLYRQHRCFRYRISQNTSNRVGEEILILPRQMSCSSSVRHLKEARAL
jgi:DNA adenine methylase